MEGELKTTKMLRCSPLETQNYRIFIKKGCFFLIFEAQAEKNLMLIL